MLIKLHHNQQTEELITLLYEVGRNTETRGPKTAKERSNWDKNISKNDKVDKKYRANFNKGHGYERDKKDLEKRNNFWIILSKGGGDQTTFTIDILIVFDSDILIV